MKTTILTLSAILLLVVAGIYYVVRGDVIAPGQAITTFEECKDAGYPIMESYPEQCNTPDGRNFVRVISDPIVPPTDPVACTMDAMQCPDGSYVGRTGPKCQFVCPQPTTGSGVRGVVMLGPNCPVMQYPPESECEDRPFKTNLVLTTSDGRTILKYFSSDAEGKFQFTVLPGTYLIRSAPGGPVMPSCAKGEAFEVRANTYTETIVSCDTGIR